MSSRGMRRAIDYSTSAAYGKPLTSVFTQKKLPLIERLIELFDDLNLENTLIIAVQHLC